MHPSPIRFPNWKEVLASADSSGGPHRLIGEWAVRFARHAGTGAGCTQSARHAHARPVGPV